VWRRGKGGDNIKSLPIPKSRGPQVSDVRSLYEETVYAFVIMDKPSH